MSEQGAGRKVLTTRQGHPVYDNQNQRTTTSFGFFEASGKVGDEPIADEPEFAPAK